MFFFKKKILLGLMVLTHGSHLLHASNLNCSSKHILCVDNNMHSNKRYKTIQSAVNKAKAGDTIVIFRGTYPEKIKISTNNLSLESAQGDEKKVIITGEKKVSSWKVSKDFHNGKKLYVAHAPSPDVQRLFIHGEEVKASRFPKKGFFEVKKNFLNEKTMMKRKFSINSQHISLLHAVAHVRTSPWRIDAVRVEKALNKPNVMDITLQRNLVVKHVSLKRKLFFTQVVSAIKDVNEWAWTKSSSNKNGLIYLMSKTKPSDISVATRSYGIILDKSVRKIKISGLHLTKINGDAIGFVTPKNSTRKCSIQDDYIIKNNEISYTTRWGINFHNNCEKGRTLIQNNILHHCRLGALKFRGVGGLSVLKNNIYDISVSSYNNDMLSEYDYSAGTGILIQSCQGAKIIDNTITRTAYCGIAIINYDRPVSGRIVSYNHIKDAMLGANDGAGIYFHTARVKPIQGKDIIQHNIVENCQGSFIGTTKNDGYYPQGVGIYIDDYSSHIDVINNTSIGSAMNMFLHEAEAIKVQNNLLIGGTHRGLYITHGGKIHAKPCQKSPLNNIITNNTIIGNKEVYSIRLKALNCRPIKQSDDNIIRTDQQAFKYRVDTPKKLQQLSLQEWQKKLNFDRNSQIIQSPKLIPLILTNPSKRTITYSDLETCTDIREKRVSSIKLKPFQSIALFNCSKHVIKEYNH